MQLFIIYLFVFVIFVQNLLAQVTVKQNNVFIRKKRYLVFPDNSIFVCTASSLKEVLLKNPHGYRTAYECDAAYMLPSKIFPNKKIPMHYRQRREIREGVTHLFDMTGFNGDACIKRIICEIQKEAPFRYSSMLKKILHTIFIDPSRDGKSGCDKNVYIECNFSLLNMVMENFVGQFLNKS